MTDKVRLVCVALVLLGAACEPTTPDFASAQLRPATDATSYAEDAGATSSRIAPASPDVTPDAEASKPEGAAGDVPLAPDTMGIAPGAASCEANGTCDSCRGSNDCLDGNRSQCDIASGVCVECLDDTQCTTAGAARCNPGDHTCYPCSDPSQCAGKPGVGPLCRGDGVCVNCTADADCGNDPNASHCGEAGQCVPCTQDGDCALVTGKTACTGDGTNGSHCVECTDNQDCTNNPNGNVCNLINGGIAAPNTCVECAANSDCRDPTASRCIQNRCQSCQTNADCSGIVSASDSTPREVCDAGICVQCTGKQFLACAGGANVCNALTRQCTPFAVGSAGICGNCFSDAHCSIDGTEHCAVQLFGTTEVGFFCFPSASNTGTCQRPFANTTTTATIDDDIVTMCQLRQTTCKGLLAFNALTPCSVDVDCGEPELNDGICVESPAGNLCSVPCGGMLDCPGSVCTGTGPAACQL